MRDYATSRQSHWQAEASRPATTREDTLAAAGLIASTNVSTRLREVARGRPVHRLRRRRQGGGQRYQNQSHVGRQGQRKGLSLGATPRNIAKITRGGGYTDWRMPTLDELYGLYDESRNGYPADCNNYCQLKITVAIHLSCYWVWASETKGWSAASVRFDGGYKDIHLQSNAEVMRALPVRRGN